MVCDRWHHPALPSLSRDRVFSRPQWQSFKLVSASNTFFALAAASADSPFTENAVNTIAAYFAASFAACSPSVLACISKPVDIVLPNRRPIVLWRIRIRIRHWCRRLNGCQDQECHPLPHNLREAAHWQQLLLLRSVIFSFRFSFPLTLDGSWRVVSGSLLKPKSPSRVFSLQPCLNGTWNRVSGWVADRVAGVQRQLRRSRGSNCPQDRFSTDIRQALMAGGPGVRNPPADLPDILDSLPA